MFLNILGAAVDAYKQLASVTRAIAHPMRLRILEELGQGEACVCHLTYVLGARQPYVSQQLMVLREAGLVQDRRDGVMVYYRLTCDCTGEVIASMHRLLRATGVDVTFPPLPPRPVAGCPCPACGGEGPCLA